MDPIVARSFGQLAAVALKKHSLENDPLLVSELGLFKLALCYAVMFTFVLETSLPVSVLVQ